MLSQSKRRTYTKLSDYDVNNTADDDQGVKGVPGIDKVMLIGRQETD